MKIGLGWLWVALFACLVPSVRAGETRPVEENGHNRTTERSAEERGYRFDAERFGQAMDRAAGVSVDQEPGGVMLQSADLGLSRILGKTVFSLAIVIGAIYGFTYFLRNFSGKTPSRSTGPLKVLAKQSLSQKSTVYVVSSLNRFLIVGESSQGLTCLSEFRDPEEVAQLMRQWGWDSNRPEDHPSRFFSRESRFAPALESHIDDLERELEKYGEVRS